MIANRRSIALMKTSTRLSSCWLSRTSSDSGSVRWSRVCAVAENQVNVASANTTSAKIRRTMKRAAASLFASRTLIWFELIGFVLLLLIGSIALLSVLTQDCVAVKGIKRFAPGVTGMIFGGFYIDGVFCR